MALQRADYQYSRTTLKRYYCNTIVENVSRAHFIANYIAANDKLCNGIICILFELELNSIHSSERQWQWRTIPSWQVGTEPLQLPNMHSVTLGPTSWNPSLHLNKALVLCSILGAMTIPCLGLLGRDLHLATKHE